MILNSFGALERSEFPKKLQTVEKMDFEIEHQQHLSFLRDIEVFSIHK